jgi:hypothetical protein
MHVSGSVPPLTAMMIRQSCIGTNRTATWPKLTNTVRTQCRLDSSKSTPGDRRDKQVPSYHVFAANETEQTQGTSVQARARHWARLVTFLL